MDYMTPLARQNQKANNEVDRTYYERSGTPGDRKANRLWEVRQLRKKELLKQLERMDNQ